MAEQQEGKTVDLFADKTTSSPAKTVPSFTPPVTTTPEVKLPEATTVVTDPPVSSNEQMNNLIKNARDANSKLKVPQTDRQRQDNLPDTAHVVPVFKNHTAKVLQILKDHGMDSQQAEKACKLLMEL